MRCPRCHHEFSSSEHCPQECPECGKSLVEPKKIQNDAIQWMRSYFLDIWRILTQPSTFFRRMPLRGGVAGPLAFALITHWIGSAIGYIWHLLIGVQFLKLIRTMTQIAGDVADVDYPGHGIRIIEARDRILEWFMGAGPVIIDPFLSFFTLLFSSFIIYLGARIFITPGVRGRPQEITYESVIRILCYGMSPAILAALPILGGFVSSLCVLIVTVVGFKIVFKIGTGRALAVYLFPKLIFLGIIGTGLIVLVLALLKMFTTLF